MLLQADGIETQGCMQKKVYLLLDKKCPGRCQVPAQMCEGACTMHNQGHCDHRYE